MHTFVIAEIGSAWNYSSTRQGIAGMAIRLAKLAGADAIKFQWTSDPRLMEARRKVEPLNYEILAWPQAWIEEFANTCVWYGIEFMCTVYLPKDVQILNPYVKRWKVASLEIDDTQLINAMAATKKMVIGSYGASQYPINGWAVDRPLHCTVAYPAPLASLNLLAIEANNFRGYSDHSKNVLTGAVAVACGAEIIEVHFRLDYTPEENPDYGHSLNEDQICEYISNIRKAELMLGDGEKKVLPCEKWALGHKVLS